jgi:hypothetical protein
MNNVNNTIRRCWFNLATGVVGTVNADLTAAITDVGNGWYRCSVTINSAFAGSQNIGFGLSDADNVFTYTGDGTSGIYIFGAQLSDSASVDPYVYQPVAAPTSTAYYGPRFDYDPVTLAPKGLLIEEQRTNLVLQSETFDSASWTKSAATVTANAVAAPNGTTTADTLTADGTSAAHRLFQTVTAYGAGRTISFFAKAGTNNFVQVFTDFTNNDFANFDLSGAGATGSKGVDTGATAITSVGNGWFRCTMVTGNAASANVNIGIISSATAARNESNTLSTTVYLWGAQLEAGAFATSYIPTVASQVTRAADSASMIGNNFARWYNQTEGTIYANFAGGLGNNPTLVSVSTGVSTNPVSAYRNSASASPSTVFKYRTFNGSTQCDINGTSASAQKIAFAVKAADYAVSENGATALTQASGLGPATADSLRLGWDAPNGGRYWNGTIARIAYYPRRLANTELQGITS